MNRTITNPANGSRQLSQVIRAELQTLEDEVSTVERSIHRISNNSAEPEINTDDYNVVVITGQSSAITSFTTNLVGTPDDGDTLRISITGTTAVALIFGSKFESSTVTLPTTTVSTDRLDLGFFWNSATGKWRCVASS